MRQHRQPAARARRRARQRDGRPPVARREPRCSSSRNCSPSHVCSRYSAAPPACSSSPLDDRSDRVASSRRRGDDDVARRSTPTCCSSPAALTIGTGLALRSLPGAPQHAARSGLDAQGSGGTAVGCAIGAARSGPRSPRRRSRCRWRSWRCAGLFTKSLLNVSRVDLGIKIDNVVTFAVSPELNGYTSERSRQLFQRLEEAIWRDAGRHRRHDSRSSRSWPATTGAATSASRDSSAGPDTDSNSPLQRGRRRLLPHDGGSADRRPRVHRRRRPRRAQGRDRQRGVRQEVQPRARRRRQAHRRSAATAQPLDTEIVGLVQNAKYSEVKREVPPLFFRPYRQDEQRRVADVLRAHRRRPGVVPRRHPQARGRRSTRTCRSRTCGR